MSIFLHSAGIRNPDLQTERPWSSKPGWQTGTHVIPEAIRVGHSGPRTPFAGAMFSHVVQQAARVMPSRAFQHADGLFSASQQSRHECCEPKQPTGASALLHCCCGTHVPAFRTPAWQIVGPDGMNPLLHVGWHRSPLSRTAGQLLTPFLGGCTALQPAALQLAGTSCPLVQMDGFCEGT